MTQLIFITLTNILLITSLISLLSNSLTNVSHDLLIHLDEMADCKQMMNNARCEKKKNTILGKYSRLTLLNREEYLFM